jgi:RNA polymerase sigma-70 factor (ECF subfamily)
METTTLREQVASHHEACFAWAVHCCGRDREEADEVLQTVYLTILEGRARFDGRSSLRTWLFGVIRRTAAEARRRRTWRLLRFLPLGEGDHAPAPSSADTASLEAEQRTLLTRALDALPARQRDVLLLVFYHDRTVDEAAAILGIGAGSARTHYARGKQRLRTLLSPILVPDGSRA